MATALVGLREPIAPLKKRVITEGTKLYFGGNDYWEAIDM